MTKISGIYSITNTINGKVYYGKCVDFKHRYYRHTEKLNKNKHPNRHLQSAWNKYGKEAFKFEVIEECSKEQLSDIEQQYLDWIKIMPRQWFYNIALNSVATWLGLHHSESTKKILAHKCRKYGKENGMFGSHRTGDKSTFFGKKHSEETKLKISRAKQINKNEYYFINKKTNEHFNGTIYQLCETYNLSKSNIHLIIKNKKRSCQDWTLA